MKLAIEGLLDQNKHAFGRITTVMITYIVFSGIPCEDTIYK